MGPSGCKLWWKFNLDYGLVDVVAANCGVSNVTGLGKRFSFEPFTKGQKGRWWEG